MFARGKVFAIVSGAALATGFDRFGSPHSHVSQCAEERAEEEGDLMALLNFEKRDFMTQSGAKARISGDKV